MSFVHFFAGLGAVLTLALLWTMGPYSNSCVNSTQHYRITMEQQELSIQQLRRKLKHVRAQRDDLFRRLGHTKIFPDSEEDNASEQGREKSSPRAFEGTSDLPQGRFLDLLPSSETSSPMELLKRMFAKLEVPKFITTIVIEVGTHANPQFLPKTKRSPNQYFIGVEPIVPRKVMPLCNGIANRCSIFPVAVGLREGTALMNVGAETSCSSLLPLHGPTGSCHSLQSFRNVTTVTLGTILRRLSSNILVEVIALDLQGFDLYALSTLARDRALRSRIGNLILECQDLSVGSPKLLSPGARTCGEAVACISQHWGFKLTACTRTVMPAEYNCVFINPANPLHSTAYRHPFVHSSTPHTITVVEHSAVCPEWFDAPTPDAAEATITEAVRMSGPTEEDKLSTQQIDEAVAHSAELRRRGRDFTLGKSEQGNEPQIEFSDSKFKTGDSIDLAQDASTTRSFRAYMHQQRQSGQLRSGQQFVQKAASIGRLRRE